MKDELTKAEIKDIEAHIERVGELRVSQALGIGRLALGHALRRVPGTRGATIECIRARLPRLGGI